jgi:hypothetical protein
MTDFNSDNNFASLDDTSIFADLASRKRVLNLNHQQVPILVVDHYGQSCEKEDLDYLRSLSIKDLELLHDFNAGLLTLIEEGLHDDYLEISDDFQDYADECEYILELISQVLEDFEEEEWINQLFHYLNRFSITKLTNYLTLIENIQFDGCVRIGNRYHVTSTYRDLFIEALTYALNEKCFVFDEVYEPSYAPQEHDGSGC